MMKLAPLGKICNVTTGQSAPQDPKAFTAEGTPFIRAGSLEGLLDGKQETQFELINETNAKKFRLKLFPKNTVVFAKSGMSAKKGRVYRLKGPCYLVSHLAAVSPSKGIDPGYLHRWFESNPPSRLIENDAYPSIKTSVIQNIEIPLPPLEEQKRIAAILDTADALRTKRRESLAQLDSLLQSVFLDMFGDPVTNPKSPVTVLGHHLTFITSGGRGWARYYSDGGNRFIRSLDVQMNSISDEDVVFVNPPDNAEAKRTKVAKDDVLLTITGSRIGRVARVPESLNGAFVSQHVAILRLGSKLMPEFVSRYLSLPGSGQLQISKMQYGQTKPGLNFDQIRSFEVPVPPLDLQRRFASIVESVEQQKARLRTHLEELDTLFASLQHRAFNGEL